MKRIFALKARLQNLKFLVNQEAIVFLMTLKEQMEDMNAQQLLEGKQPNGSDISPQYALESYANFKRSITPNAKRGKFTPNLKLTGDFHESIEVKFFSDRIEFVATDRKAEFILKKYGSVLGLSVDNKRIIITTLKHHLLVFIIDTLKRRQ